MKRTKIICTIGPASEKVETLRKMIQAGMNFARLNLSHAELSYHAKLIRTVRAAAASLGAPVGIIADLQGPKIRLGKLPKDGLELRRGAQIALAFRRSGKGNLAVTYKDMHKDVKAGNRILIDDGLVELKAVRVKAGKIYAEVIVPGRVTSNKGINLPDSKVSLKSLTAKDRRDVKFAVGKNVEWIALSFVRGARDIQDLRKLLRGKPQKVIAKIEKGEALENIDEIIKASDGLMVARGDLGIEVPAERVPLAQKDIIRKCLFAGKPVIVATQMLDSMIRNPRPTRAEVSDVANAVIDHTDAVMLSGETASGAYPLKAVQVMSKIIAKTETSRYDDLDISYFGHRQASLLAAAEAAAHLSAEDKVKFVYVDGDDALLLSQIISHFRQERRIAVKVKNKFDAAQINLNWGITPLTGKSDWRQMASKGDKILMITANRRQTEMRIYRPLAK